MTQMKNVDVKSEVEGQKYSSIAKLIAEIWSF